MTFTECNNNLLEDGTLSAETSVGGPQHPGYVCINLDHEADGSDHLVLTSSSPVHITHFTLLLWKLCQGNNWYGTAVTVTFSVDDDDIKSSGLSVAEAETPYEIEPPVAPVNRITIDLQCAIGHQNNICLDIAGCPQGKLQDRK